jgi:hypothetical protein
LPSTPGEARCACSQSSRGDQPSTVPSRVANGAWLSSAAPGTGAAGTAPTGVAPGAAGAGAAAGAGSRATSAPLAIARATAALPIVRLSESTCEVDSAWPAPGNAIRVSGAGAAVLIGAATCGVS